MRPVKIRFLMIVVALLTALIICGSWLLQERRRSRPWTDSVSCANHAIQLKLLFYRYGEAAESFPAVGNARDAFTKMGAAVGHAHAGWFSHPASACPESYRANGGIGYVFVADGLSTKQVVEHDALVFFCPAASHQGARDAHALQGTLNLQCLRNDAERIAVLERALQQAKSGEVPYSPGAIARIKEDLAARE